MRLRSRMSGCESWGLDHSAGSSSFFSMDASSERRRAGSKILPQVANLVAHGRVGEFEIVQHDRGPDFFLLVYRQPHLHGLSEASVLYNGSSNSGSVFPCGALRWPICRWMPA